MRGGQRDYWLERARQCRAYARTVGGDVAARLLAMAERYERLAEKTP